MGNHLSLASRAAAPPPSDLSTPLTEKQAEVARLVGYGYSYDRIAEELGVVAPTVRFHVLAIAKKLPEPSVGKPYRTVYMWVNAHRYQPPPPELSPEESEERKRLFRFKNHARKQVKDAVQRNRLVKPAVCPRCEQPTPARRMHAHHTDYTKPLDVQWLCASCHRAEHGKRAG